MSGIARGLRNGAQRVTRAAEEGVANAAGRAVRQMAHGSERVARNTVEAEAEHVEHLRSLHSSGEPVAKPKRKRSKPPVTGYDALDKLNRSRRPAIRKRQQYEIFKNAKRHENGEDFICPSSGKKIPCDRDAGGKAKRFNEQGKQLKESDPGYAKGFTRPKPNTKQTKNYNFGHVQGSEFWRLKQLVKDHDKQFEWSDVRDEYDRPSHYQIEDPETNQAHGSEDKSPGYGHYGGLHDRLHRNQSGATGSAAPDSLAGTGTRPRRRR